MKGIIIAFVGVVLLVVAFVTIRGLYAGARYAAAVGMAKADVNSLSIGGYGKKPQGPHTIKGTVVMDTSQGIPAVPYIQYVNTNGRKATKQLVYMDARACGAGAGDFPCVPTYSASTGYPRLIGGETVEVSGYIYENRFLITSLSRG